MTEENISCNWHFLELGVMVHDQYSKYNSNLGQNSKTLHHIRKKHSNTYRDVEVITSRLVHFSVAYHTFPSIQATIFNMPKHSDPTYQFNISTETQLKVFKSIT